MKAFAQAITYISVGVVLLLSFQNCAQHGFEALNGDIQGDGLSLSSALRPMAELNSDIRNILQQSQQPSVLFNGVNAVRLSVKAAGLGPNSDLVINPGEVVVIDSSIDVNTLTINGALACDNGITGSQSIRAKTIYVNGVFECGSSEASRFLGSLQIFLKDDGATTSSRRGFLVNRDGTLKLFGDDRKAGWQKISTTAQAGANSIVAENSVAGKWQSGDSIVIGPTSYDLEETETAKIVSISADGRTITLDRNLRFSHWGTIQQFSGKNGSVALDQRAEIANLNRNIRIMPDESGGVITDQNGIGGHMMVLPGGKAYVDSIELYHMGQAGLMGRYPFHWHKGRDVYGQFIRNSSIHHTFQRCLTVHSVQRALVQNNVCYNYRGHGYFLEEGDEIDNILVGNLAVYGRRPLADKVLLDSDRGGSFDEARASAMSGFWISHPRNVIRGNVVAGTQGTGFWNSFITGDIANTNGTIINNNPVTINGVRVIPKPNRSETTDFSENVAHANVVGMNWDGAPGGTSANNPRNPDDKLLESAHYFPPVTPTFFNLVNFKNINTGIYFRGQTVVFENALFADNGWSMFFAYNQIVKNSTVIGQSRNHSEADDRFLYTEQKRFPRKQHGIVLYDGPFELKNVNFLNFPSSRIMKTIDGVSRDVTPSVFGDIGGHRRYFNQVYGLHFSPEPYYRMFQEHGEVVRGSSYRHGWLDVLSSSHLRDVDGSLTGVPGGLVVPGTGANADGSCQSQSFGGNPSFTGYKVCRSGAKVFNLFINGRGPGSNGNKVPYLVVRNDGEAAIPFLADRVNIDQILDLIANPNESVYNNKFNMLEGHDYSVIFRPSDVQSRNSALPDLVVSLATESMGEVSPVVRFIGLGQNCRFLRSDVRRAGSLDELRRTSETAYYVSGNEFYFRIKSFEKSWQMGVGGESRQAVGDYELTCSAPSQPQVMGHIDSVSAGSNPVISGWACEQTKSQSIQVHLYAGGAAGAGGVYIGSYPADQESEGGVLAACGVYKGAYRFKIAVPASAVAAHGGKKIYVHGISSVGGVNPQLSNSGNLSLPGGTSNPGAPPTPTPAPPTPAPPTPAPPTPAPPTPTPPAPAPTPVITGNIDYIAGNVIHGWACDKGVARSIDVHAYVGGSSGMAGAVLAVAGRADHEGRDNAAVRAACGVSSGVYRFAIVLPREIQRVHAGKKIYVHGISTSPSRVNLTINNSGNLTVPAAEANQVTGVVDQVSSARVVNGWACNYGLAQSIKVHIYAASSGGDPVYVGEATANQSSEAAVRSACGVGSGNYRYSFMLPSSAAGKKIYVYGISVSGDRKNLSLINSGVFVAP